MTKEILFRGKCENTGEWHYGGIETNRVHFAIIYDKEMPYNNLCKVIPETVGQYTGKEDIKHKKIFEHDIIRFNKKYIAKIIYNQKTCSFEAWYTFIAGAYGEKATNTFNLTSLDDIEVIGNIHNNPELLGEE